MHLIMWIHEIIAQNITDIDFEEDTIETQYKE